MASDRRDIEWRRLPANDPDADCRIEHWIALAPIWLLPSFFPLLGRYGARRIVALSSTSRFVKIESADARERELAALLADGEQHLQGWAESTGRQWLILRPTLVYGLGRDKNISEMARFIWRFGFFPLFAGGRGLRQPVHANDVARACATVVSATSPTNGAYNLSGAGTLTYREMVISIFKALGKRPRLIPMPLWGGALAMSLLRMHPKYRHWSAAMIERMGRDLVFDHDRAARDFGFAPTAFALSADDLPATDGN
jgi:nucleoside-diphosphate-sugar epimerase